jgi:hypothetical protein
MDAAKIGLSPEETALVLNSRWILTKNIILHKAVQLLAGLQEDYSGSLSSKQGKLPAEFLSGSPKISKGENYEGLPYRILDYPAVFQKENILAVRTMFWWGNFFSITLHLSGRYKEQFEKKIMAAFDSLSANDFFICTGTGQWVHCFRTDNYTSVSATDKEKFKAIVAEKIFLKIAAKADVTDWEAASELLKNRFEFLIKMIAG